MGKQDEDKKETADRRAKGERQLSAVAATAREQVWRTLSAIPDMQTEMRAVLDGAVGDALAKSGSALAMPMTLGVNGRKLEETDNWSRVIPDAQPSIAVFLHGLMASERIWWFGGAEQSLGDRLAPAVGVTPVYVRYNSGLHISTNGRELARQLQVLVDRWPVPVTEINIIGHSMGGLVARSSCHYAEAEGHRWLDDLKRLFLIAAPLRGVPIEQLINYATVALGAIPTIPTWLMSWLFKQRSDGVKDLRHGYLVDEDWMGRDQDKLTRGRTWVPLIEGVQHYIVAGVMNKDPASPLSKILGDSLVTPTSAVDEATDGRHSEGPIRGVRLIPKASHNQLLTRVDVFEQILRWWTRPPPSLRAPRNLKD